MTTAVIIIILVVICVFAVKSYMKKLSKGCCGGGADKEQRTENQTDKADCRYKYKITVGGMKCENCSVRLENAFNRQKGVTAEVSLKDKTALVYSVASISELILRKTVADLGYSAENITDESENAEQNNKVTEE